MGWCIQEWWGYDWQLVWAHERGNVEILCPNFVRELMSGEGVWSTNFTKNRLNEICCRPPTFQKTQTSSHFGKHHKSLNGCQPCPSEPILIYIKGMKTWKMILRLSSRKLLLSLEKRWLHNSCTKYYFFLKKEHCSVWAAWVISIHLILVIGMISICL